VSSDVATGVPRVPVPFPLYGPKARKNIRVFRKMGF
jgi:hypothetical protein